MRVIKIGPFEQPQMVEAIARVYQQSFGGEPWNEGYLCPVCETAFALSPIIKKCPACSARSQTVLVIEYWPMSKVLTDFYREMRRPDPICVVAQLPDQSIVGFAWGYRVNADAKLDEHLDAPALHESLQGDFFYLDECAVLPAYQGKGRGIGRLIVSSIFREQQRPDVLLRTMNNSPMYHLIKHLGGEIIRHISRGRVIMRLLIS